MIKSWINRCYLCNTGCPIKVKHLFVKRFFTFFSGILWPPNSPDLNPLDYSIWSILEEKACSKPHPNLDSLKKALTKAWNEISLETLIKTVDDFPKRLAACIAANGGYFE